MSMHRFPHADIREGDEVHVHERQHWGIGVVTDARDSSLVRVYFPLLERELTVGRAAVDRRLSIAWDPGPFLCPVCPGMSRTPRT